MTRILFIIPFLSSGGAERVVSIWASELAALGKDIHLLVFYRVENEFSINDKVFIHVIKENKDEYHNLRKLEKFILIRKALKNINPDVVLPFISYVGIMISILRVGLPIKVIETIRIDPRYSPKNKFLRWMRNISVFFSDRCIVQTNSQLTYFPFFMRNRITVFANPIDAEFAKEAKKFTEKKITKLIAVGRLEKQKNYPMLISAFADVLQCNRDLNLDIYGEGSLYEELLFYINKLNINERVRLCGRTKDISSVLLESDLFILSSEAEGMPNALMEAMAVGLPCISTDCPTGPADLIENEINGLLIPVGDKDALVEAIYKMLNNIDAAIEMGIKARMKILGRYSADSSALELIEFINSI